LDSGGARDEVEELSCLGIKRGNFNCVYGDKYYVFEDIDFNSLNQNAVQGGVNAVPDGSGGGGKLSPISLDDEPTVAEREALLSGGGLSGSGE
jgi:hypothetical protein